MSRKTSVDCLLLAGGFARQVLAVGDGDGDNDDDDTSRDAGS